MDDVLVKAYREALADERQKNAQLLEENLLLRRMLEELAYSRDLLKLRRVS